MTFVVYLALEPYVRRTWPVILITWSRLVSGQLRDPLVGRDLLVARSPGCSCRSSAPRSFSRRRWRASHNRDWLSRCWCRYGSRSTFATILNQPFNALLNGMMVVLMLLLIRQGVKWLASQVPGLPGRVIGSEWTIMATSVLLFVIVIKRNNLDAINPIADIIAAVIPLLCLIGVTLRFGLVA